MGSTVRVVVTADESYVVPMAASVRSMIENFGPIGMLEVLVLSCNISEVSKDRLWRSWTEGNCRVSFVDVEPDLLSSMPLQSSVHSALTPAHYVPLLLSQFLPADWDRVLCLDVDTITRVSLTELWRTPLNGALLGAVADDYVPTVGSAFGVQAWRELDLDPSTPYFNSGVMVIDLAAWRRLSIHEQALQYVRDHGDRIVQSDQEALNAVVNGQWLEVGTEWNVTGYWRKPERRVGRHAHVFEDAKIRHFAGVMKPWLQRHPEVPDEHLYFDYLARTHWGKAQ